ncbi:hypothetical protein [Treponema pectinovorum]|uniref:hypothetical protein n=3 Tax=Treponema pectinovorum TaxID=164 RepID=UPI0011CB46FD|nr:hypothetical protein [Treponema pectinovorum]
MAFKRRCANQFLNILFGSAFLFTSCVTMADYNYSRIYSNLGGGRYSQVRMELDENKSSIYTSRDKVLYLLDKGVLEHFEGLNQVSNESLSQSEKLMEDFSATSITQTIASGVTNDNVKDYAGEDFENIYTNIFMALNYLALQKNESAMVEVRRFDNKLKVLKQKYNAEVDNLNSESEVKVKNVSVQFSDSALARYLSLLLYRADGDFGNAEVDQRFIAKAFKSQPSLYPFEIPSCVKDELSVPKDMARLNVIAFSGRAPIKKENVIRVPWDFNHWYKLALPEMEKQPSHINRIEVEVFNKNSLEQKRFELEKIESIEDIALDTFQRNYSLIFAKSLARSIARTAINSGLQQVSNDKDTAPEVALLLGTFSFIHQLATEFIERADVRCSRYFPATASVSGINLEPGNYTVKVNFCRGKFVQYSQEKDVKLVAENLNLVEAACLR